MKVPLGFSGGRLLALEAPRPVRLEVEARVSWLRLGLELLRLLLLPDFPPARRSKTFAPAAFGASRMDADLDNLSIREFLRLSGFLRSFREWPGLMLPGSGSGASPSSSSSTLIIGTDVTYLPSTRVES